LLVCQLTSVAGFSVEQRNSTGCKIECSRLALFWLLKLAHIYTVTINKNLQTETLRFKEKIVFKKVKLLATFTILNNSFSVSLCPPKFMKSHLWQPTISKFSERLCPLTAQGWLGPSGLALNYAPCHALLDACENFC